VIAEEIAEAANAAARPLEPAQVPDDLIENAKVERAAAEVPVPEQPVQTIGDSEEPDDDAFRTVRGGPA
jgi:hypothetical protein